MHPNLNQNRASDNRYKKVKTEDIVSSIVRKAQLPESKKTLHTLTREQLVELLAYLEKSEEWREFYEEMENKENAN